MDDIEVVIDASKHFKYHEPNGTTPLNRISHLPESKRHLKMAIKERIKLLVGAYISLASFVDDDLVDLVEESIKNVDKEKIKKVSSIYKKVLKDMKTLQAEIEAFEPLKVTNT